LNETGTLDVKSRRLEIFSGLEMAAKIRELGRKGVIIQRDKGVGEMNADE
jgi:hypothetical protein